MLHPICIIRINKCLGVEFLTEHFFSTFWTYKHLRTYFRILTTHREYFFALNDLRTHFFITVFAVFFHR